MKVIRVIPLERAFGGDELSYFSSSDIIPGSIVTATLRKKTSFAVVKSSEEVSDLKSSIKSSSFGLKKINKVILSGLYSQQYMEAAKETADYFACSVGAVLSSTTPKAVFKKLAKIYSKSVGIDKKPSSCQKYILQTEDLERFAQYRSLIRESFTKKESVLIVTATIQDGTVLKKAVEKGIEDYVLMLHSNMKDREIADMWGRAMSFGHPVVLIETAGFLSSIRADVGTVIIERESSPAYKMQSRPFVDFRYFTEKLAEKMSLRLILGDIMLRTETVASFKNGNYLELIPPKWRSQSRSSQQVIDMKTYKPDLNSKFTVISRELTLMIDEARNSNENIFIFVARKGLAPTTVCGDCGSILLCPNCSSPMVLHNTLNNRRYYLCHRCGDRRDATLRCAYCNSWKLVMLGVGVERVIEELKKKFPLVKYFRLDRESVKDRNEAMQKIDEFFNSPGSVLIGTELALLYMDRTIGYGAVASIDSLFSVPDFKINERIMNILIKMRAITTNKFLIQTRQSDIPLINFAIEGNLAGFYQSEIDLRKQFGYPPYSVFIKLTMPEGVTALAEMNSLKIHFGDNPLYVFPAFSNRGAAKHVLNGLIKMPSGSWPNIKTLAFLRSLPPKFQIDVDPGSIL